MKNRLFTTLILLIGLLALTLNGCTFSLLDIPGLSPATPTSPYPPTPIPSLQPVAEITFRVALPLPLLPGETLLLSVVDEVTGLSLNPSNYPMTAEDALHYSVTIPFTPGSVVKYRYVRQATLPILEDDSADQLVRYRMYYVTGPGLVEDVVAGWSDAPFAGPTGRLSGQVVDAATGAAIPNILIAAGGQQTLTDSSGAFYIEGLPPGTHNLVAYALDGSYMTFQQGARIETGRRTPVTISLTAAPMVNVIFTVIMPHETAPVTAPVRLAGNLLQLGNTFGDLRGGMNTVASRMPVLSPLPDGRYTITLALPAGADIRYKYTLGDGFWNAEHRNNGSFVVRQLIVPQGQTTLLVEDAIETWRAGNSAPILFDVSVPANTPVGDIVSIQFNPYGWTEPIPMWPMGNNRWRYQLFSPLNMLGTFEYRYCRNDQCGVADDLQTSAGRHGRPVSTALIAQNLQDSISAWNWLPANPNGQLVGVSVTPRSPDFWTGVEIQPGYDPTYQPWTSLAMQNIQSIGANWVVLTPSWTVERSLPFVFSPVPGSDPLWADLLDSVGRARATGLNVALFPQPNLPVTASDWWQATRRDADWWETWFNRYQAFVFYHADLASRTGAQALILGGDWIAPALPGGRLADGQPSGAPDDAATRWRNLITETRRHFGGAIYWAVSYPNGLETLPDFVSEVDGIYLLWYAPLGDSTLVADMQVEAGRLMDRDLLPLQMALRKPIVIAAAVPSADGAAQASLSEQVLFQPGTSGARVNLQLQVDVYQALLEAVDDRPWIAGFVSRGYYLPAILQDASASIHGKPAADLLWYWYPRLRGVAP
ncbi:MAG: carboxypeptidase regulatory-like domain-containing protein [Anaerolineales bacterium]